MKRLVRYTQFSVLLLSLLSGTQIANAQYFTASKGDLLAGFRKTGAFKGNYELVVNLGNITNFEAVSAGATINITNFATSQLSAAFSSYNNLQWSVSAAFGGSGSWSGFPASTLWYTVPRINPGSRSDAPIRD